MFTAGHFDSEMVFRGTSRYPSSHGSTLVETAEGDLLAAWYAGSREKGTDVVILTSRKRLGKPWSKPKVAADTPGKPEGNPVLARDPEGLLLFYQTMHGSGEGPTTKTSGWTTCDIKLKQSKDGEAWSPDSYVRRRWGYVIRSKPLLIDGRLLLPAQNEVKWSSLVLIRDPDGRWRESNEVDTGEGFKKGNIEPSIVELSSGNLLMYMRSGSRTCIWSSISGDRGENWSEPRATNLPNPDSAVELLRLRSRTLLAFNNTSAGRCPLTVAISDDDGNTWHSFKDLEKEPGEYSYPAMIADREGLVHVTYTYRRQGIKHATFDEAWLG